MEKITYETYRAMLINPDTPDEEILRYSKVVPGRTAFAPELIADPDKVAMSEDELSAESAMRIGNGLARWRRNRRVERALQQGDPRPLLVAEGDSWFQFPLLIREVVDHLGDDYLVWCVSAAGDTARNMVFGAPEYMDALRRHEGRVAGFLLSAAGNDIIGEDEDARDGTPALIRILKRPADASSMMPADYVDMSVLGERLAFLHTAYQRVISDIRNDPAFTTLPIYFHGYDIPFPYPWEQDSRNPAWAARDQWLGRAFNHHGINQPELRRNILRLMIDALYDMLGRLAGNPEETGVHVVDCRGAMPSVTDWADEIHGTSNGFAAVAREFARTIEGAMAGRGRPGMA
jgi:hypothetical protein